MKSMNRRPELGEAMTLIELLVVVAIITILMGFTLPHLMKVRGEVGIAAARSQVGAMSTAMELYKTEAGAYPIDSSAIFGADIPEFLFIGLHNKGTVSLGGVETGQLHDAKHEWIGFLNGQDDSVESFESLPLNANPLGLIEHSSVKFQMAHRVRVRTAKSMVEAKGLPVFIDYWGNAWHYREWESKGQDFKDKASALDSGPDACEHPDSYDLWSNGPDGVNNFGASDSDDIRR
jgi:prepilin-type N-terminal cleavage/methylation domain-containing protein